MRDDTTKKGRLIAVQVAGCVFTAAVIEERNAFGLTRVEVFYDVGQSAKNYWTDQEMEDYEIK